MAVGISAAYIRSGTMDTVLIHCVHSHLWSDEMAKGLAMAVHCDRCDCVLKDYHGRMIPGECLCDSQLYGSNHILCRKCSRFEDEQVDEAGTNNLPQLLASYNRLED